MKFTSWNSERRASRDADDLNLDPSPNFFGEACSNDSDAWSASEDAESDRLANQSKKSRRSHYNDDDLGLDVSEAKSWRRTILVIVYLKTLSTVSLKWLVAVMLRKIFVWLEETFSGGSSLFGLPTSGFWNAIFLNTVDFYTLLGLSMGPIVMIALGTGIIRALPVRLAGVYARAQRARLVEIALTTMALTEMNVDANYLLEQISLLNEYESHVQGPRLDSVVRIVVVTIFCFVLFWQATVFTVLLFAITILLRFSLQDRLLQEPYRRRAEITSNVHTSIDDVLRGADVVATHNMEWREMNALAAKEAPGIKIDRHIWRVLLIMGFPELFAVGLMLPGVLLLARLMFDNTDSVSDAINTLFALTAMFFVFDEGHKGLITLILTSSQAQSYKQSLGVVNEVLAAVPPRQRLRENFKKDGDHDSEMESDPVVPGSLVFENVTVQYPRTSAPAVRDISFTIPQGLTMAIVAESGGGKSTLFRVASALVRHQSGNVFYGNIALNDLTKHAIRKHMGFVSQDSMLFARTIRENIWYGNVGEPDDSVIWSVLENLGLGSWVHSLDDGLGTVLATERMVSGGQAQRLQIARLLCRQDVYYVLLDECMSALDPVMRATVTQALKVFLRGKTAMVITHSHDTVSDLCDKVLDLGKLAHGEDRAIQSAREYLSSLEHGASATSSAWRALFSRMAV